MSSSIIRFNAHLSRAGHYYDVPVIIMTYRSLLRRISNVHKNNNPFKTMRMYINFNKFSWRTIISKCSKISTQPERYKKMSLGIDLHI